MLSKINFHALRHHITLLFRITKEKETLHYGIGNRCADGLYTVFLDYDSVPFEWVTEEIDLLQELYELSTAYIFKTKNGYHVIFLDKMPLIDLLQVIHTTSIDTNYIRVPLEYARKVWVLRQSNKKDESIKYLGCVERRTENEYVYDKSGAHKLFLTKYCGVPLKDFGSRIEYDREETIIMGYYRIMPGND